MTDANQLPKIHTRLLERPLLAVIDSAATHSFISHSYLPAETTLKPATFGTHLAAMGSTMAVIGQAEIQVTIQERCFFISVLVAPKLRTPLLLGLPWLIREGAIIDFTRGVLYIGEHERITVPFVGGTKNTSTSNSSEIPPLKNGFPERYSQRFRETVRNHANVFAPLGGQLPQTKSIQHTITVTTKQAFRMPHYRYSEEKRREIDQQIKEMLAAQIIEPSTSAYNSPIVMAKKKDGSFRFCVDYRRLNSITEDTVQPIPRITDTLKDIGDATIFSTIDLRSGYWQIPMEPDSKKFTAFSTPSGCCYQFRVMPFGLKGAPGTFQRLMSQEVLTGYIDQFCKVYLDDVIIYSKTYDEHLHHIAKILERLDIHGLTAAPDKWHGSRPLPREIGRRERHH